MAKTITNKTLKSVKKAYNDNFEKLMNSIGKAAHKNYAKRDIALSKEEESIMRKLSIPTADPCKRKQAYYSPCSICEERFSCKFWKMVLKDERGWKKKDGLL